MYNSLDSTHQAWGRGLNERQTDFRRDSQKGIKIAILALGALSLGGIVAGGLEDAGLVSLNRRNVKVIATTTVFSLIGLVLACLLYHAPRRRQTQVLFEERCEACRQRDLEQQRELEEIV